MLDSIAVYLKLYNFHVSQLYERFVEVKEEVTNLVKYEDMIQDEAHDLTPISALHDRIIARYELWKYVEVTSFAINEWMHTPFHKVIVFIMLY